MKAVHPSTLRAIIRRYERQQQIVVIMNGHVVFEMTLAQIRASNAMQDARKSKRIYIEVL